MKITDCLTPDRICFLAGNTKQEAIAELVEAICQSPAIGDPDELERSIWHREEMMSTGIGMGIAVPHVRLSSVREPVMALGVHREGLHDYASLDDKPVQIISLIAAGAGQHSLYIRLLAQLAEMLKQPGIREAILAENTPQGVYEILGRETGK